MPLSANFSNFKPANNKLKKGDFEGAWYTVLANIYGVTRSDIEQRERKRKLRQRQIKTTVATIIAIVLAISFFFTIKAQDDAEQKAELVRKSQIEVEKQKKFAQRGTYNDKLTRVSKLWQQDPSLAYKLLLDTKEDHRDFNRRPFRQSGCQRPPGITKRAHGQSQPCHIKRAEP